MLEAIATNPPRILLMLATGAGKTFIAFQLAWKLFQSRWNLSGEPTRRPRILFLADRNVLANQAYNAFSAFPEDALVRISPADIRKKGRVPKNGSLFFTIFQTFMSGMGGDGKPAPYFGEYPPDFFDFIVIDECHRGGANDESNWRCIMEYFAPAGAAWLDRDAQASRERRYLPLFRRAGLCLFPQGGHQDGFLTPFKVKQVQTTLDYYVFTPDDTVVEGEIETGRIYEEKDFNRNIEIRERDLINQVKTSNNPNYCQRVTANDGELGEQHLRDFQDNEKMIPTPDHLAKAFHRRRCAQHTQHRLAASEQLHDRVQADHRARDASLRRERLFHHLRLR